MSNAKTSISRRFLAALLSFVLVLGLLPTSTFTAFAATAEHPDAITVSVTDQDGKALAGVTVAYSVSSTANGDDYASGTVTTDANGCVEVLAKDKYVADDLTLSATAALTDYVYADGSGRIEGGCNYFGYAGLRNSASQHQDSWGNGCCKQRARISKRHGTEFGNRSWN